MLGARSFELLKRLVIKAEIVLAFFFFYYLYMLEDQRAFPMRIVDLTADNFFTRFLFWVIYFA